MRTMKTRGTGRKKRREGLGNRLAIIGITVVVLSLAVVVNVKNTSMEKKLVEYQAKEESLTRQVENEPCAACFSRWASCGCCRNCSAMWVFT